MQQNRGIVIAKLEPEKLTLSRAGGTNLAHSVRMLSEDRRDIMVVKLDMKNAHNEVARAATIEALQKDPTTRHLAWSPSPSDGQDVGLRLGGSCWQVPHLESLWLAYS